MSQPEIGYVNILEQQMQARINMNGETVASPIRPSSAGDCMRKNAYRLMEHKGKANYNCEPLSPAVVMLLDHGTDIEHQLIRHFEQNGFEVLYHQQTLLFPTLKSKIDPTFNQNVTGSIDFVLKKGDFVAVADVKSVGGTKYSWDAKTKKFLTMKSVKALSDNAFWIEDLDAFLEELQDPFLTVNLAQLNYYANSDFIKKLGIDHAIILQYSKSDSRLRELRFRPSEKLFQKSNQSFIEAIEAAAAGKPGSASGFPRENVACRYCRYSHVCPNTNPAHSADNQQEM